MHTALFITLISLGAVPVEVRPLAGPVQQGELVSLDSQQLILAVVDQQSELATGSLWEVAPRNAPKPSGNQPTIWLRLIDGSLLSATNYSAAGGTAQLTLASGDTISLRTRTIDWVCFRNFADAPELQKQWDEIVAQKAAGDTIVFRRLSSLDYLVGILHGVTDKNVEFEYEGERVELRREKLDGMLYYHPAGSSLPDRLCQVIDADGCVFNAREIRLKDGRIELTCSVGLKYALPVARLAKLDFSSGNTVWLSELPPDSVEWRPYFGSRVSLPRLEKLFRPRMDQAANGKPLTLDGQVFTRGISLHSRTELVYRLTDDFRFFHAIVGIDDQVGDQGDVNLVISGDGRPLYSQRITGSDAAVPVNLEITGVRRLTILVDFGGQMDVGDYLDLGDARLTK